MRPEVGPEPGHPGWRDRAFRRSVEPSAKELLSNLFFAQAVSPSDSSEDGIERSESEGFVIRDWNTVVRHRSSLENDVAALLMNLLVSKGSLEMAGQITPRQVTR